MLLTGRRCRGKGNLPFPCELEMPMSQQAERGTKRQCQNADCRARFYDLNRTPIVCPICSATFEIAPVAPKTSGKPEEDKKSPAEVEAVATMDAPDGAELVEEEDEAALADVEPVEDEIAGDDDNDTFLEDEGEEGGDVSGIIGTAVKSDEEDT